MNFRSHTYTLINILLLFLSFNTILAQNTTLEKIKSIYEIQDEDKEVFEHIYLHLPKLVFWENEYIWFAGYVYEPNYKLPALETTNVYCGIYDSKGNQVVKEIFYAANGKFSGQLRLPKDFGTGKFYIKAYTNWMKNYPKEQSFVQDIYIVNSEDKEIPEDIDDDLEIILSAEGGHLVADIENTVSVYLRSNQVNLEISKCDIINDKGEVILNSISLNQSGNGKFYITPYLNENYSLRLITSDGQELTRELSKPRETGFAVTFNNIIDDKIIINLKTNAKTLLKHKNESFYLAIHNNDLHEIIEFKVDEMDNILVILRDKLPESINYFTFYNNDLEPIVTRTIYNKTNNILTSNADIKLTKKKNDSLKLTITPNNLSLKDNISSFVSVAVIPVESVSSNINLNIRNWLKLRPSIGDKQTRLLHLNGNDDKKTQYNIDLSLMLSKANNIEDKDIKPKNQYQFEQGFSISGRIHIPYDFESKKLFAFQQKHGQFLTTTIKDNNTFLFKNIYLVANDELSLSIEDRNDLESKQVDLVFKPVIKKDSLTVDELSQQTNFQVSKITQSNEVKYGNIKLSTFSNNNALDEVVVKAEKKTNMTRNKGLTVGTFETKKIGKEERRKWPKLSSYVRRLGFKVRQNFQNNSFFIFGKNIMDNHPPVVYVDGFRTNEEIQDFTLNMIDEIYYEHFGVEGSDGGTIYIYTRFDFSDDKQAIAGKKSETGYSVAMPFENTTFDDYTIKDFLSYGLIYWNGNTQFDQKGSLNITFPTFNLNEFIIQVNGFTERGDLISIQEKVILND